MDQAVHPDWIAVDWGTSHMRAYAMTADGHALAQSEGPGMGALARSESSFEDAFLAAVRAWDLGSTASIVMCGMVGSRQGWQEARYLPAPSNLHTLQDQMVAVRTRSARLADTPVWIVPGLSQAEPYDVMRGEETQLAGYVAHCSRIGNASDGLVCLPGTHSKWARLEQETVVGFTTAMTGELFELLSKKSILAHAVGGDHWDGEAFGEAVDSAYRQPNRVLQDLFSIRAESLLVGENGNRARARLSGLLIGAELAGTGLGNVRAAAVIGADHLCHLYADALRAIGVVAMTHAGEPMVLQGLHRLSHGLSTRVDVPA